MKIYIVTDGCYSEYRIEAVFLDKEKAYNYKKLQCEYGEVEEWYTMDDEYNVILPKIIEYYHVVLSTKGEVIECDKKRYEQYPGMQDFNETSAYNSKRIVYNIATDSKEKAIKIARDKRMQYLAETFGI